jgi:hypothetical protein
MIPTKEGQIAKFHTSLPSEDPDQLYVVLQVIEDDERPRADIKALGTGLGSFVPINSVRLTDLEVVEVSTVDMIGHTVTITKSDYSQVEGRVINVNEQKVMLDLTKGEKGVETNVWITILDKEGVEHMGSLFVK